jgi:hypothetical protein
MKLHGSLRTLIIFAVLSACSSSTAPKPSLAGTWHVTLGALNSGTLSPASFDVTVKQSGSNYTVTMPTLTWTGGLVFDSGPNIEGFSDTTETGFIAFTHGPHAHICQFVAVGGFKNASLDTLSSAGVIVENVDTIPGGYCARGTVSGTATVHK